MRVILIHGVGLPNPALFGTHLEELIARLAPRAALTITRVDWHQVVGAAEADAGDFLPGEANRQQVAGLMRGFVGAAWRGHAVRWPLRVLEVLLLAAPLAAWVAAGLLLWGLYESLVRWHAPTALQVAARLLWKAVAWPFPPALYPVAPRVLLAWAAVTIPFVAAAFALCCVRNGGWAAQRVLAATLLRPLVFFASLATQPLVAWYLIVSLLGASVPWAAYHDPQVPVVPDATFVVSPGLPQTATDSAYNAMLLGYLMLGAGVAAVWLFARIVRLPLKVLADVLCYMGDREYAARVLAHVDAQIQPSTHPAGEPLVLVGHSLGSVIALDWLLQNQERLDPAAEIRLITLGSPLRRLITRFFGGVFPPPGEAAAQLSARFPGFRWLNLYRPFDPIGAALFGGQGGRGVDVSTRQWWKVWFGAHTGYWDDETVLAAASRFLSEAAPSPRAQPMPASAPYRPEWTSADEGVAFLGRLSRGANAAARPVLAVALTIAAVISTRGWWSGSAADKAAMRRDLAANGVTTTGWVYEVRLIDVFVDLEGQPPTPPRETPYTVTVFRKAEGGYVGFEGLGPLGGSLRDLSSPQARPGGPQTAVMTGGSPAERWPVTVRYLPGTPSTFELVGPARQPPRWVERAAGVLRGILVAGWALVCLAMFATVLGAGGGVYFGRHRP